MQNLASRQRRPLKSWLILASFALIGSALLAGCGDDQAQAKRQYNEALTVIKNAQQGFVPASARDYGISELKQGSVPVQNQVRQTDYRQKKFDRAITKLQAVAKQGGSGYQGSALRLLGQIEMSKARYLRDQADQAAGAVINDTANLMNLASKATSAQQRKQTFTSNDPQLLEAYDKGISDNQQTLQKLQKQAQAKRKQISEQQSKAKSQKALASDKATQAQKLRTQAFTANGEKKFQLRDLQAKADRAGSAASFQAQRHQAKIDQYQVALAPLESQLDSLTQSIKQLKKKKAEVKKQAESIQTKRTTAAAKAEQAVQKVLSEYEKVAGQFEQRVQGGYDKAVGQIDKAIEDLSKAQGAVQGSRGRSNPSTALLTARTEKVGILSRYAAALAGQKRIVDHLVQTLKTVADLPEDSALAQGLAQLQTQHKQILDRSNSALKEARNLAGQLGDDSAQIWSQTLNNYASRLSG